MYKSKLVLGAALLAMAGFASAQTTNPDRPATTSDRPGTTTPAPSTTSPGVTSSPSAPSSPSTSSSAVSPSAPMASDTRTTTTESRTYRDPATGRMTNDPARMDNTARAPRYDRN